MRSSRLLAAAVLGLMAGAPAFAVEMSSNGTKVHRLVVDSAGGGRSASAGVVKKANFTVGGISTGTASSANFSLSTGFQKVRAYPGTVVNLDATQGDGAGSIDLSWTAPGADGRLGTATSYVLKYSTEAITTQEQFEAATTYVQAYTPAAPGAAEAKTLTGFSTGQTLHFAIEAKSNNDRAYLSNDDSATSPLSGNPVFITVSVSTPAMESTVRVTTVTVKLLDQTGIVAPGFGVDLKVESSPAGVTFSPDASGTAFALLSDTTGEASIVVREDLSAVPTASYAAFQSSISVRIQNGATQTLLLTEDQVDSFSIAVSTSLRQDLRVMVATVTLLDAGAAPVVGLPVAISTFTNSTRVSVSTTPVYTDVNGRAEFTFSLTEGSSNDFDDYADFIASATFVALAQAAQEKNYLVESNMLDDFELTGSTRVAVGVEFNVAIYPRNAYDRRLPRYGGEVTLASRIAGSNVQSLGSLAVTQGTIVGGVLEITNQTYNNVENIEIRAIRLIDSKFGRSGTIAITGPTQFEVTLPTQTLANANFNMTIRALDENGAQVIGYGGTLSLSAVLASNINEPGTGSLGVTAIGFPSNGTLTMTNQSYTRGETVRIKIEDTALGVASLSPPIQFTLVQSNISHFMVVLPTAAPVGVPFSMTIVAVDTSSNPVSDPVNTRIDLAPVLQGTDVAGSGNLAVRSVVIPINSTHVVIAAQSYNRIETLELKAQDDFGKKGRSTQIKIKGPEVLEVSVPTTTIKAGDPFRVIIVAKDDLGQTVQGYNGTLTLSAVDASSTTQSGGGILGLTALQVVSGVGVTEFQSYTKAELIRIRAVDTAINAVGLSNALDVGIGPPASIDLSANPGSIIQGEVSQLRATVRDVFGNVVPGSTITYTVQAGSGTLARDLAGLTLNLQSTTSVSDADGRAEAIFGLPSGLTEAQTNIVRVNVGALTDSATIFVSVLIPSAGGGVVLQSADPRTKVTIPANAFPFDVSVSIKDEAEIVASIAAKAAAAFAKQTGQFIDDFLKQIQIFRGNTQADAGTASQPVQLEFPFDVVSSSEVEVEGLSFGASVGPLARVQGVLVPASVLRVYKLNQVEDLWEQVSEGSIANIGAQRITAGVSNASGVYALGTPPFRDVAPTASATLATTLGTGATVEVQVPVGAFDTTVRMTVDTIATSRLVAPGVATLRATGLAVEVQAGGMQPKKQLTLTIKYSAAQIAGFNEALLRVARFDETTQSWVLLSSQVDSRNKKVIGFTDHLSTFQVMQVQPQATFDAATVFPNPFRPSQGHTVVNFGNLIAGATVKVYTVNGRFLRKLTADLSGLIVWDGRDADGSPLASGVYLALIESGDAKRTLKFAVQK